MCMCICVYSCGRVEFTFLYTLFIRNSGQGMFLKKFLNKFVIFVANDSYEFLNFLLLLSLR